MTYDFLYEQPNGSIGIYTVDNALTEYEASRRAKQEKPEALDALLEVIEHTTYNLKSKDYQNYGGRGIDMCNRWEDSFSNFLSDMGKRPSINHSIDRINNDKGYSKENCKWSTKSEQNLNKRNNVLFEGKTNSEWALILGISAQAINYRMKKFNNPHGVKNVI